jgi:tetratricopeptide (TPR) repeat protein
VAPLGLLYVLPVAFIPVRVSLDRECKVDARSFITSACCESDCEPSNRVSKDHRSGRTFATTRDKLPRTMKTLRIESLVILALISACGGAATPPAAEPTKAHVPTQIISTTADGTAKELLDRGERALMARQWLDAANAFSTLIAANPDDASMQAALFGLATAYEGEDQLEKARTTYKDLWQKYPNGINARTSIQREAAIHAYLEEWQALGETAAALLARKDIDDVDRMMALGARGLSRIESGDESGASKDVQDGLDLVDTNHYGDGGRLPIAAAELRFALGEVRRVRAEKIALTPVTSDFLSKINARCEGLLEAQSAYADAIRSIDPHWAAMSGSRIGEMYRTLHRDLMNIPPQNAKTEKDRQLFYGMMHVRYRALLDKGIEMVRRTVDFGAKNNDSTAWVKRAEASLKEMDLALEDEKNQIAKFPFTEEELQKALDILEKKTLAKQAESAKSVDTKKKAATHRSE